jgi:hypothetical protein
MLFAVCTVGLTSCSEPEVPAFIPASAADSVVISAFYDKLETLYTTTTEDNTAPDSACKLTLFNQENICVVPLVDLAARLAGKANEATEQDPFHSLALNCPLEADVWKHYTQEFAKEVKKIEAAKYLIVLENAHYEKPTPDETGFQTGMLSGYVSVYNYDDLVLRCKTEVYAENSSYVFTEETEESSNIESELLTDLQGQINTAVNKSLSTIFGTTITLN